MRKTVSFIFVDLVLSFTISTKHNVQGVNLGSNLASNSTRLRTENCWSILDAVKLYNDMEKLEGRYANATQEFQNLLKIDKFDEQMNEAIIQPLGTGDPKTIPVGLNMGSHGIVRLPYTLLIFKNVKLPKPASFRVDSLHTDVQNMVLGVRISMDTLRLMGDYIRSDIVQGPSVLVYMPHNGTLEMVMDKVEYKMEGRLRVIKDQLDVEMVVSDVKFKNLTLMYQSNVTNQTLINLQEKHIYDFFDRMKADLDNRMKTYFNDYLKNHKLSNPIPAFFLEYYNTKSKALNQYFDSAIINLIKRIKELGVNATAIPDFKIISVDNTEFEIHRGVLRGLDSMYRRSNVKTSKQGDVRLIDALVSFSDLKIEYKYKVKLPSGNVTGSLTLNAEDLTVHMRLNAVKSPVKVEIHVDSVQHMKPDNLAVEGAQEVSIAKLKSSMGQHILAILKSALYHLVKQLESLTRCESSYRRYIPKKNKDTIELKPDILNLTICIFCCDSSCDLHVNAENIIETIKG